jgi:hypothetical protein
MENKSHLFTMGPIPYLWTQEANSLGCSTGVVGNSLWFYVGINKGSKRFKIDRNIDLLSKVSRQTRQSALLKLHAAGLIVLTLRKGAYPIVEIIDATHRAGRPQRYSATNTLETKTFNAAAQAGSGPNFRKTNFQKQGYSHEKQTAFNFS